MSCDITWYSCDTIVWYSCAGSSPIFLLIFSQGVLRVLRCRSWIQLCQCTWREEESRLLMVEHSSTHTHTHPLISHTHPHTSHASHLNPSPLSLTLPLAMMSGLRLYWVHIFRLGSVSFTACLRTPKWSASSLEFFQGGKWREMTRSLLLATVKPLSWRSCSESFR